MEKLGPTGQRVGQRLRELRQERGLTLAALEEKLADLGRPILLSALSKIEKGQRRVDVDDLVALAQALDVSPNLLILPSPHGPEVEVALTESTSLDVDAAWTWAVKDRPPSKSARGIFISYSHHDEAWASWMASCLEKAGYEVGFDAWDLAPGADIQSFIIDRIAQAACVLVVVSANVERSKWVGYELTLAIAKNLPILPVSVDGHSSNSAVLARREGVRLADEPETEARKSVLAAVRKLGIRPKPVGNPTKFPSVPAAPSSLAGAGFSLAPLHRLIVAVDIEDSTRRENVARAAIRADMYELLDGALIQCGITEELREPIVDLGDGALVLLHPDDRVPMTLLLNTFVPMLTEMISNHAEVHPDRRFRLRVAIHSGDVHFDRRGPFGEDLDITFRMLNSLELKMRLSRADAPLVVVVSDRVHHSVIRHGYDGIDAHSFEPIVRFELADQRHRGWVQVPAYTAGSVELD